jgi:tetratricopeptide (TPR) repeat protein
VTKRGRTTPAAPARHGSQEASKEAAKEVAQPVQRPSDSASAAAAGRSRLDALLDKLPFAGLIVAGLFSLRRLDDFDTWWHLASGRWIAQHRQVPHTDVLSYTVPQNEWINLQWLYDLLLYWVWLLGGADALILASVACFVGTFVLLAKHLRRYVGPVATTLLIGWVATTVNERFLIRPEMASFPLLAALQWHLAKGRDQPQKLWWLAVLMLIWVNMHSLFILGIGAIVCTIGAALIAELPILPAAWRRDAAWPAPARAALLRWGGIAIAVTLVNPYLLRALLFPVELMSRIDGSSPVYSAIGEFRAPFSGYFLTFAIGSYQAFFFAAIGLAVVAGALRATAPTPRRGSVEHERFDIGALVFAAALAYLSVLARRNIGVFAIGAVPFVGACLGIVLARLPKSWTALSSVPVRAAAAATFLAATGISAGVVSNHWYAMTGETHEFGLGQFESNFHERANEFFREQKLSGPTYNDMTAGGYLTWDDPSGKGVYVDGRLEVYDTPFFGAYLGNISNIEAWRKDAASRGIQTATIFHRWGNRHGLIRALTGTSDWRLVYFDETVAMFAKLGSNDDAIGNSRQAFTTTWRPRTEAELSSPVRTWSWQWSVDRYTGQLAYARLLETLGERQGALRWYEAALELGLPPEFEVGTRQRAAQYRAQSGELAQARVHLEKALETDPDDAETRGMLARLDSLQKK